MGGDDSQKLLPWRGIHSSPGRKPPAQLRINNVTETAGWNLARGTPSFWPRPQVQTAWVTFGKQRRGKSAARRSPAGRRFSQYLGRHVSPSAIFGANGVPIGRMTQDYRRLNATGEHLIHGLYFVERSRPIRKDAAIRIEHQ